MSDFAIVLGLLVVVSVGLESFASTTAVNQVNPDSPADRVNAVRVSVSQGRMTWRNLSWPVVGSVHTPRGRFRLSGAKSGRSYGLPGALIPFRFQSAAEMSKSHPYFWKVKKEGLDGTTFGIHMNNLAPGQISAGCLLVSERDLNQMARLLPNATIVIAN